MDLFSGSTVVSRFAKKLGFRVLSNDWEPYSEQIAKGTVVLNKIPKFEKLGGYENAFKILNDVEPIEDYVTRHLCPSDDNNLDHEKDRLFFMRKNGMKIDAMRELISYWVAKHSPGLLPNAVTNPHNFPLRRQYEILRKGSQPRTISMYPCGLPPKSPCGLLAATVR